MHVGACGCHTSRSSRQDVELCLQLCLNNFQLYGQIFLAHSVNVFCGMEAGSSNKVDWFSISLGKRKEEDFWLKEHVNLTAMA